MLQNSLNPYLEPKQPTFRPSLLGPLEFVSEAADLIVSVEDMKNYLKVAITVDDSLIEVMIRAATKYCQESIGGKRQLLPAVFNLPVAAWWYGKPLQMPRPPLQSVGSVKYYDPLSTQQTLDSSNYRVNVPWRMPGRIELVLNSLQPAVDCYREYPIMIQFACGYTDVNAVPYEAKLAVMKLVKDQYDLRGATTPVWNAGAAGAYGVGDLLDSLCSGGYA